MRKKEWYEREISREVNILQLNAKNESRFQ
jgi:hypothetical protein